MGYQGSSRAKVSDVVGIEALEVLTSRKRIKWAARVYGIRANFVGWGKEKRLMRAKYLSLV